MTNQTVIPAATAGDTAAETLSMTPESVSFPGGVESLLYKYMRRVIDVNGFAFIDEGVSYNGIEFTTEELAYLNALETRARDES